MCHFKHETDLNNDIFMRVKKTVLFSRQNYELNSFQEFCQEDEVLLS